MAIQGVVRPNEDLPVKHAESAEEFVDAVHATGNPVRAVRTCEEVEDSETEMRVRVWLEVEEGDHRLVHVEHLPVEAPTGIVVTGGSTWRVLLEDPSVQVWPDHPKNGRLPPDRRLSPPPQG